MWLMLMTSAGFAQVDPRCEELASGGVPDGYDEQAQQDFLQNYFALGSTLSPVHGPVPHRAGRGAIGIDLGGLPPLPCSRRLVLNYTKTERVNRSPVLPRLRFVLSGPAIGQMIPYVGAAFLPPIPLAGQTTTVVSLESGVGFQFGPRWQVGARFHATSHKTVGEISEPFLPSDPAFDDLFTANTFGLDASVGVRLGEEEGTEATPYLSVGVTDVSTTYYVGDDNVAVNNFHPYFGLVASLGVDIAMAEQIRFGIEAYAAPGGISKPDPTVESIRPVSRYGQLITGRMRLAYEL